MVRPDRGNVDVDVAIVVIVTDGAALAVDFNRKPRLFGYIGEGSVLVVVIERRVGFPRLMARPVHGVDQQYVLPPVLVIVEKAGAAAHGFRQVLFPKRSVVVFEVDAGLGSYVGELDRSRSPGGGGIRSWCWRRRY